MDEKRWLGAALGGAALGPAPPAMLDVARAEGVCALLHARLAQGLELGELGVALAREQRAAIARELLRAPSLALLWGSLRDPCLLLKGEALAHWCYPMPHMRSREDVDLLFADEAAARRAMGALIDAGFEFDRSSYLPGGSQLTVKRDGLDVDLHWQLSNHSVFGARLSFAELWARRQTPAGLALPCLGRSDAFLHAAIHRIANAQAGVADRLIWLVDFRQIAAHMTADDWRQLLDTAVARELAAPCADAMRATADWLHAAFPADVVAALDRAALGESFDPQRAASRAYLERTALASLPLGERWSALRRRLFPDHDYMRARYRLSSSAQLPAAYLNRWLSALRMLWRR